jgi:UDP-N-acetylmuramoylalanine--D-glutamate ligase
MSQFLPQLAGGGGPRPKGVVEGPPSKTAVIHRRPSTIRFANGPPPRDKLGEEFDWST